MKLSMFGVLLLSVALLISHTRTADAERLKDLVDVVGAKSNQLVGYGIVVGLQGSGDSQKAEFTLQSVTAMLRRLGVRVDPGKIKLKNAAAVIVTADVPPFMKVGQALDVTVSSLGDAKSLRGGTLILTPLSGADRVVYAVAQGALSVGGFTAASRGSSRQSGHTTVGRIPGGALIEREILTSISFDRRIKLSLRDPDPQVAAALVSKINEALEGEVATAQDPGMIEVSIPASYESREVELLSVISELEVTRSVPARIVINERTGTVVIGEGVRLRPAAIAHGGLIVQIQRSAAVSQPPSLSISGTTEVIEETQITADTVPGDLHGIPATATVSDLVNALNALGVKPADLIVIFQSLLSAGAISAQLEVQ